MRVVLHSIMSSISSECRIGKFIPMRHVESGLWHGSDHERKFIRNLKSEPLTWYYRNNQVTYTLNSMGYRAPEFDMIDWNNSIVLIGCSNVFGVGLSNSHTIAYQLEQLTGFPVINMGASSTSIQFAFHNNIMLHTGYPVPKAVINIWSGKDRCIYYNEDSVHNFGPWDTESGSYYDKWTEKMSHSDANAVLLTMAVRQLWKDKTNYYEASFFENTSVLLNIPELNKLDYARDLTHPGIQSTGVAAQTLATGLGLG